MSYLQIITICSSIYFLEYQFTAIADAFVTNFNLIIRFILEEAIRHKSYTLERRLNYYGYLTSKMIILKACLAVFILTDALPLGFGDDGVPKVIVDKSHYEVDFGNPVTLSCLIISDLPLTMVYWQRNTSGLLRRLDAGLAGTDGMTIDNPSLTIKYATSVDVGFYTCFALNTAGTGKSMKTRVKVTGGVPSVHVDSTYYTVPYGSNVTMPCTIKAFPLVRSVFWQRNISGVIKTLNAGSLGTKGILLSNPSLTIVSTTLEDSGLYSCFAANLVGTGTSEAVYLKVKGDVPLVHSNTVNKTADYGTSVVLHCSIVSDPPTIQVFWEKRIDGLIKTINIENSSIGMTSRDMSLHFKAVTITDSGEYTCYAINIIGKGSSQKITLKVNGGKPNVRVGAIAYSVVYGSSITLQCVVMADPIHTLVYWEKKINGITSTLNQHAVGTSGMSRLSPSLSISTVTRTDEGTYTCFAGNAAGVGASQPTFVSVVGDIPKVTISTTHYRVNYGESVTLHCEVLSVPLHTLVYWHRARNSTIQTIKLDSPGITGVRTNEPSLTIVSATLSDSGLYTCFAKNAVGTAKSQMSSNLIVSGNFPVVTVMSETYIAEVNSLVVLNCKIDSNPKPIRVYWHQKTNDGMVTLITQGMMGIEGSTVENPSLIINKLTDSMTGNYTCFATNDLGTTQSVTVQLFVYPQDNITASQSDQTSDSLLNVNAIAAIAGFGFLFTVLFSVFVHFVYKRKCKNSRPSVREQEQASSQIFSDLSITNRNITGIGHQETAC